MRDPERLRVVQQALREMHRKLFELKSAEIVSLRETLDAEGRTVDASRDALVGATRLIESTREAVLAAEHTVAVTRKTLDIVSRAHDAMAVLYETDNDLEDVADNPDGP